MSEATASSRRPVGPPVAIDPECAAALAAAGPTAARTVTWEAIPRLRADLEAEAPTLEELQRNGAFLVEKHAAPGVAGAVPLLVVRPPGAAAGAAALYFIHGGGMVMGTNRSGLVTMLDLAATLGLVVVSVEYRLAPEHPDPAPVEDCFAGLQWTAGAAGELGIDPSRLIVAGPSAGGGLAAGVALLARDRSGPDLAGQLLMCPMLDDRDDSTSARQMDGHGVWDRTSNRTGWTALLGQRRGGVDVSPYAAPARADDLSRLPPAYLDVGSAETFRDETIAYANAIWLAGGGAELHVWPGAFHRHDHFAEATPLGRSTWAAREDWLRRLLRAEHPGT
jgi:acetyl esterase/lipase